MPGFLDNRERNVIPRWRDFLSTVYLGELNAGKPASIIVPPIYDLSSIAADWERNKSASFAGDLISAAIVGRNLPAAREASEFVITLSEDVSPQLHALAQRVLAGNPKTFRDVIKPLDLTEGQSFQKSPEISSARRRLSNYPSDAVLWMDLAYLYAVRGLSSKAERCTRIALNLAPANRFILRSSARFFVHVGRPDIAHDLIRRSPDYKEDPWLLAAEVSVALAAKRTPWSTRESFSLLNAERFSPHHISELSSALGTLEFNSGNSSKAKKLFRRSLQKPNDNSLAQAKWIWRQVWGVPADFNVEEFKIDRPFEAAAFEALGQSDWKKAYSSTLQWLGDEPFSSEPARLASYISATVFEDFARAEELANFGLVTNPNDPGFHIGLAFSYASTGRRDEAYSELSKIELSESEDWVGAAIEANYGLLAFRGGYAESGRKRYGMAVQKADLIKDKRTKLTALVYWATEELALPDSNSVSLLAEALEANKAASGYFNSFLLQRLTERISKKFV